MYELCDPECNECIEACTNNCLKKDQTYKILLLSHPDRCEWCESCYMVCNNGALNLQFIDDGLDRTIMEDQIIMNILNEELRVLQNMRIIYNQKMEEETDKEVKEKLKEKIEVIDTEISKRLKESQL